MKTFHQHGRGEYVGKLAFLGGSAVPRPGPGASGASRRRFARGIIKSQNCLESKCLESKWLEPKWLRISVIPLRILGVIGILGRTRDMAQAHPTPALHFHFAILGPIIHY